MYSYSKIPGIQHSFKMNPITSPDAGIKSSKNHKDTKISDAFKTLAERFREIDEIGQFEKLRQEIELPLKNSTISKAMIVIAPSQNKNDFRTRVLSFVAYSPFTDEVKLSIAQATGNKFAIDSVLKDSSTITAFKEFIKESEKYFLSNYSA